MISDIGKHRVRHGNVMESLDELMGNVKADIIYTDPPWGKGNLAYWQTMNTKMNGVEKIDIDYDDFLNRIFDVAAKYLNDDGILFVEYGQRWKDLVVEKAENVGFTCQLVIEMLYGNSPPRPLDLIIFSRKSLSISDEYQDAVYHTTGYKSLQAAITPFIDNQSVILDPCCGMGYTAQFAIDNGLTFYGNEINKKRLDKTINRLKKAVK